MVSERVRKNGELLVQVCESLYIIGFLGGK